MITQLKIAINLLGRHTDNEAKHDRYASRTYANDIHSLDLTGRITGPELLLVSICHCHRKM